jgi:hypothetical protein
LFHPLLLCSFYLKEFPLLVFPFFSFGFMVITSYATPRADFYHNPPSIRFLFISEQITSLLSFFLFIFHFLFVIKIPARSTPSFFLATIVIFRLKLIDWLVLLLTFPPSNFFSFDLFATDLSSSKR